MRVIKIIFVGSLLSQSMAIWIYGAEESLPDSMTFKISIVSWILSPILTDISKENRNQNLIDEIGYRINRSPVRFLFFAFYTFGGLLAILIKWYLEKKASKESIIISEKE